MAGLDLGLAGLRVVPTPRHAGVLLVIGPVPSGLAPAVGTAYAQMPRPRAIFAVGITAIPGLPDPDVVAPCDQAALLAGVTELRRRIADGAFNPNASLYEAEAVQTRTEYVCPMHPQIVQDLPGSCPICGMNLVPREATGPTDGHERMPAPERSDQAMEKSRSAAASEYTCPMHPEIVQPEPGACPICGMVLVPREQPIATSESPSAETPAETTRYTCPMHPEIVQDSPGSCPICGMFLEPQAAESGVPPPSPSEPPSAGHTTYTCPMHPEVQQSEPGRCPICGMNLAPSSEIASSSTGTDAHGGHGGQSPDPKGRDPHAVGDTGQQEEQSVRGAEHAGHDMTMPGQSVPELPGHSGHQMSMSAGMTVDHAGRTMAHDGHMMAHDGHMMADDGHGGGFMSMVAITRDLPRSGDGLPMEWIEAPFGPLFPGLPGGLQVMLTLDGDTVAKAELIPGSTRRGMEEALSGSLTGLPDRVADFDRLAPGAYAVLAATALDPEAGNQTRRSRIATLERIRAMSHLGWLSGFLDLLGIGWLAERAAALQLAVVQATAAKDLEPLQRRAKRLRDDIERLPLLHRRLAGVGRLDRDDVEHVTGPVARAAGVARDERRDAPDYAELDFKPVMREGNDALARLLVRASEVEQSIALAMAADQPTASPAAHGRRADRAGSAALELPRGAARLHLMMADDGMVHGAHLDTPSTALATLVPRVAAQAEAGDALVAIASLDLSPWELDR